MDRSNVREAALLASGLGLVLAFFAMSSSVVGTDVGFRPPWNNHTPGELHFWVCWLLLLLPGALMVGAALSRRLEGPLRRGFARLECLDARERRVALLLLFGLALLVARLGHTFVLLDFWVTDDEPAARLGGQILASGRFMLPLPPVWDVFPNAFLYVNAARTAYASIDWSGVQLAWALAELTRTGSLVFALMAALPAPLVAVAVARRIGFGWGLVAGAIVLISPMAMMLSFTTHAHVLSRGWMAAALCLYVLARSGSDAGRMPLARWAACGLCFGLAFITRPFETALLAAPLGGLTLWEAAFEDRRMRVALLAIVAGAALPLAFFAAHNAILTGQAWRPPRFAHEAMFTGPHRSPFAFLSDPGVLWSRLGNNVAYNVMMLCLWFLGPLGVAAVGYGVGVDRFTRALGAGVIANLSLGLLHDDAGLHIVGPIHYSETVVPLAMLAAHGLARARVRLDERVATWGEAAAGLRVAAGRVAATLAVAGLIGLGTFSAWHARGLHAQAQIHASIFGAIDSLELENAVLLAPHYAYVWSAVPDFEATGAWVFHWPPVDPDRSDDVILVHDLGVSTSAERLALVRREFPGRRFYALVGADADHRLIVEPIPGDRLEGREPRGDAARLPDRGPLPPS